MNSTIYSKTHLLFKNEGLDGASAELQVPPSTSITIMWDGTSAEPHYTGDEFFISNSLFTAAFFDYLIHKKAQQKAAAEDVPPPNGKKLQTKSTQISRTTQLLKRPMKKS